MQGMYKTVVGVVSAKHSVATELEPRSRNDSVMSGDGASALVVQRTDEPGKGILSTHLHSDGADAEILAMYYPGSHANRWMPDKPDFAGDQELGGLFMTHEIVDHPASLPYMDGPAVFKKAVVKFPEVIKEALAANGLTEKDIDLLVPHQANLRISQYVQKLLKLSDDQVFNNIQKYGNSAAAWVPIALCEACEAGKVKDGELVCLAAFGSGFTGASALIRW